MSRLFVAVEVPEDVRASLREQIEAVTFRVLRWSNPENYHLTLAFLGDADPELVARALNAIMPSGGEILFRVENWGAFPRPTSARVVWAGVQAEGLRELAAVVKAACRPAAPEMDTSEYTPHLTLARSKQNLRLTGEAGLKMEIGPFEWTADRYSLFESKLNPKGASYTRLAEFRI